MVYMYMEPYWLINHMHILNYNTNLTHTHYTHTLQHYVYHVLQA